MSSLPDGPLTLGRVIAERYEVVRMLHHGRSGSVYEARAIDGVAESERVALKVLHPRLCADRQVHGRFHREARIIERLEGSRVVRLLDFVEEDQLLLLVLEYVDGPSLRSVLEAGGALAPPLALDIAAELCVALEEAHEGGVIHRDLKPANILLEGWQRPEANGDSVPEPGESWRARVVDFGLGKILYGDLAGTALTEQDMIFGTPDYMSPEQVRGDELDPRCDLYAVGAILFEMLSGEVPYPTAGPLTTMDAHLDDPVPSLRERAPDLELPDSVDQLIGQALAKSRESRHTSAQALANALGSVRASLSDESADDNGGEPIASADEAGPASGSESESIGTTMKSHRVSALEVAVPRGAKVELRVLDADPDSGEAPTRRLEPALAERPWRGERGPSERNFWTIATLIAAAVAVAVGVWLGVR